MVGKLIKIKSDNNDALKKLLNDLNLAEIMNNDDKKVIEQNKKWTPEEWYQQLKKRWYFHGSSWYMRQALRAERLSDKK